MNDDDDQKKHRRPRRPPRRKSGDTAVALQTGDATPIETNGNGASHDALVPRVLEGEIIDRAAAGSIRVLAMRSPFSMAREERFIPEGSTLADICARLEIKDWQDALIAVDGVPVAQRWWSAVRPKAAHVVTIRVVPRGGGGGGDKGWIQVAAGVILIIVGVLVAIYGGPFAVFAPYIITMGVGLALSGAIQLLFPPPSLPKLKSGSGSESPVFSITGSRNVPNPYGAVPGVWGADAPPVSFSKAP